MVYDMCEGYLICLVLVCGFPVLLRLPQKVRSELVGQSRALFLVVLFARQEPVFEPEEPVFGSRWRKIAYFCRKFSLPAKGIWLNVLPRNHVITDV